MTHALLIYGWPPSPLALMVAGENESYNTPEKPMTVRPPKELPAELLPKWTPLSSVYRNGDDWWVFPPSGPGFWNGYRDCRPAQNTREIMRTKLGYVLIPNIQQESPMQETIKALGMTFTPNTDNVVKGRTLAEFKWGERVVCLKSGRNLQDFQGIMIPSPDFVGRRVCLVDAGYTDGSYRDEPCWYSPADLVDGKPRSVPQTKTVGECKSGDVFLYNKHWLVAQHNEETGGKWFAKLWHAVGATRHINPRETVTVVGTLTWSRP